MRTRITVTRADSKIYRNRGSDAAVWVIVAFAALYFLTRVINDIDQHEQVGLVVFDGLLTIAFAIPAVRYPWHRVIARPERLVIRNITRTHSVAWDDVVEFQLTRHDPWPRVGVAVLRTGQRIPMTALQAARVTRVAERAISDLRQELQKRAVAGAAASPARVPRPARSETLE